MPDPGSWYLVCTPAPGGEPTLAFWRHERQLTRRLAALLTAVLGLGAWTVLGVPGNGAGPRPEKNTWGLVRSSTGEYGPFRERTRPKATQSSLSSSCARGESDAGACGDTTGRPEPITLLLFGTMLAGLGVVVRRKLRGRTRTTG
jgi:hypothetical protein